VSTLRRDYIDRVAKKKPFNNPFGSVKLDRPAPPPPKREHPLR
jgi:hypothetical protein